MLVYIGSLESGEGTPRGSTKPKRATWDMSTPRGDLLNQPGVGFIVAEQAQVTIIDVYNSQLSFYCQIIIPIHSVEKGVAFSCLLLQVILGAQLRILDFFYLCVQPSEEELRKRKEKVMMMQLKRREEQEMKKQQKAAELAAKAEAARNKEMVSIQYIIFCYL